MRLKVLAFARAREVFGFSEQEIDCNPEDTPRDILIRLSPSADVQNMRVAVDLEYSDLNAPLGGAEELAIIPPVSGG
jgi:molybdopterin converting factor small subunit